MIVNGLIITLSLIIMSFFLHKYKIVYILDSIWVFVLMVFNNGGGDYVEYYGIYQSYKNVIPKFLSSDYLYGFLCHVSQKLGFDFVLFNSIITAIALIIFIFIIYKMSTKPCIVMALFMLLPMVDFIQQKRNFLASVIIIYALYVFNKSNKDLKDKIQYSLLCCIAAGFHTIGYIYIFLIFIDKIKRISFNYQTIILFSVSIFLIPFYPYIASLLFQSSKVNLYFYDLSNRLSISKTMVFVSIQIIFFVLHFFIFKNIKSFRKNDSLIKLDYFMLFLSPIYYYNSTFFRIYKNIIVFQYSDYTMLFSSNGKYSKKSLQLICIYFIFIILVFLFSYVLFGDIGADVLIGGIFKYNSLLTLL
ncbi:EpsG family protein [Candidatus Stoquefichus massiliensis]|uniref:EpsG family protein n=1 Tax=Candidatus Stoquefichus massiliensis TaxID=1470350 RepID=UPI0004809EA2|nr:EpsG family protein [Candidatus Stoquefichus massiliensis]